MSTIIRRLMNRLYPSNGHSVTILGTGWAGKTTLLYLLKLGEVVQTISSIGFNVETIDAPTTSGTPLKLTCWDMGAGCANISTFASMAAAYTTSSEAIIWVVDGVDRYLLKESIEALSAFLLQIDSEDQKAGKSRNLPILLLVNKQDLANPIPISEIYQAFAKPLSGRSSCIFKTSAIQTSIDKSGLPEAFEWLRYALENASRGRPTPLTPPTLPDQRDASMLSKKLDSWVTRAENDSDSSQFISQFHSLSLPAWDHYTHIRIAFLLLTMHGRQKGKDIIFEGIEKYITGSPQTRGRTFHVSMTYFWIQVVHLGIRNISPSTDLTGSSDTTLPSNMKDIASPDQFALFLALNPYVADGNLWADYYSKEVMMSPAAKSMMVLPDKKPLPNLVVRDAI